MWLWQGTKCQKLTGPLCGLQLGSLDAHPGCELSLATLGVKGHPKLGNRGLREDINGHGSAREQRFCEGQKLRKGMEVGSEEKPVAWIERQLSNPTPTLYHHRSQAYILLGKDPGLEILQQEGGTLAR